MKSTTYHLHTISGLHVGTGQGIGVIDMPIARERASNLPLVPGSGIKGVLRDECRPEDKNDKDYLALFGLETNDDPSRFAGALAVSDAHLLCLPIRSWKGTFAWVTCPMVLQRYKRDLSEEIDIPSLEEDQAKRTDTTTLLEENMIFLEDLDLHAQTGAQEWSEFIANQVFEDDEWKALFKERFLIVHDNVFDFLSETATEVRARIEIKTKERTAKAGALWYEEYLPAETILWGEIASDDARNSSDKDATALLNTIPSNERLQIGGNATIGAGQVRWIMGKV